MAENIISDSDLKMIRDLDSSRIERDAIAKQLSSLKLETVLLEEKREAIEQSLANLRDARKIDEETRNIYLEEKEQALQLNLSKLEKDKHLFKVDLDNLNKKKEDLNAQELVLKSKLEGAKSWELNLSKKDDAFSLKEKALEERAFLLDKNKEANINSAKELDDLKVLESKRITELEVKLAELGEQERNNKLISSSLAKKTSDLEDFRLNLKEKSSSNDILAKELAEEKLLVDKKEADLNDQISDLQSKEISLKQRERKLEIHSLEVDVLEKEVRDKERELIFKQKLAE